MEKLAFWINYVHKGSNMIMFLYEIKNFKVKRCFPEIITISNDLVISKSMSSFVPKYWLNWQILVAILN